MSTQPTVHPTPHAAAGLRRRALIAALGLAVAAAVLPADAASVMLALLFAVTVRRDRSGASR